MEVARWNWQRCRGSRSTPDGSSGEADSAVFRKSHERRFGNFQPTRDIFRRLEARGGEKNGTEHGKARASGQVGGQ